MFIEIILIVLGILSLIYTLFNHEMHLLYSMNPNFIKEEKKRYNKDFEVNKLSAPRGPSMSGNKYEIDADTKKLVVTSEERSTLISYLL